MEVCINGYWGHVCDDGWDTTKTLVVCKQLFGENISKMNYSMSYTCVYLSAVFPMQSSGYSIFKLCIWQ